MNDRAIALAVRGVEVAEAGPNDARAANAFVGTTRRRAASWRRHVQLAGDEAQDIRVGRSFEVASKVEVLSRLVAKKMRQHSCGVVAVNPVGVKGLFGDLCDALFDAVDEPLSPGAVDACEAKGGATALAYEGFGFEEASRDEALRGDGRGLVNPRAVPLLLDARRSDEENVRRAVGGEDVSQPVHIGAAVRVVASSTGARRIHDGVEGESAEGPAQSRQREEVCLHKLRAAGGRRRTPQRRDLVSTLHQHCRQGTPDVATSCDQNLHFVRRSLGHISESARFSGIPGEIDVIHRVRLLFRLGCRIPVLAQDRRANARTRRERVILPLVQRIGVMALWVLVACASGTTDVNTGRTDAGDRPDVRIPGSDGAVMDIRMGTDAGTPCVDDSYPDACNLAESVTMMTGDVLNIEGFLPTLSGADWFLIEFPPMSGPNMQGMGTPSIVLDGDSTMVIEVRDGCDATLPVSCGEGSAREATSYSFVDDQSMPGEADGDGSDTFTTRDVPWPETLAVRVGRRGGPANCDAYTLTISR